MTSKFFRRCLSTKLPFPNTELPPPRLDYRALSENVTAKSLNALNRKAPINPDTLPTLARTYGEWKRVNMDLNELRNKRSIVGHQIRSVFNADKQLGLQEEKHPVLAEAADLKASIKYLEAELSTLDALLLALALPIPNDTHPSSPLGPESAAKIIHESHPPTHLLPPNPNRDHLKTATQLSLIDFKSGATTTGHAWCFLQNEAALLELALTHYALSIATRRGYSPILPPDVVRADIAHRCGFRPRDAPDQAASEHHHTYHITPAHTPASAPELILAGTAEIPLAGTFANKLLPSSALPAKLVGMSHSFRAEAGARSADTRGLYRVHQFTKVELFVVCQEAGSDEMLEEMLALQKEILDGLNLPYR